MPTFSDYLRDEVNNKVLRNVDFSITGGCYVSLHDGAPGRDGSNEKTGGSYARQTGTFAASSDGTGTSTHAIVFTLMPSGTISHAGLWNALSGGDFLIGDALSVSKIVNEGDTFQFDAGDLSMYLD